MPKKILMKIAAADVTFAFIETGNYYVKNGKTQYIQNKIQQAHIAYKEGLWYRGKPMIFKLTDRLGIPIPQNELYVPTTAPTA